MLLECLVPFPYAGKPLKPGDLFETEKDLDALILKTAGKARDASKMPVKAKTPKAEAKVLKPIAEGGAPDIGETSRRRRRYMRRDMVAKD